MRRLPTGDVTLVFTDIEGSTRLLDALGDRYGRLLAQHHHLLRAVWEEHGGVEVNTNGDAFFVAFLRPEEAVAAAHAAQRAVASAHWPEGATVRLRMGVHTGKPRVRADDYWGVDVHYAARLCAAAHGGQVLVSATTARRTGAVLHDLGPHRLKDFPEPRSLFQLGGEPGAFPPPRTLDPVPTNLPAPAGRLVGRERAAADLVRRLSGEQRLVTLTGAGGTGKTRLAIEAARELLAVFPHGVFLVPLEAVGDFRQMLAAVVEELGLPELPGVDPVRRLHQHVRDRRILLVLDNMEHLLPAAEDVRKLVEAGSGVAVLVTSQAPLRVRGETVVELPPLELPPPSPVPVDDLRRVPSVALLTEQARAATPSFEITEENAPAVAELCRRVDGVPLALELAAVRLGLLGPDELLHRLDETLDALGAGRRDLPARQRGLRATLQWTLGLLSDADRRALAALSVFDAGFTVRLAEAARPHILENLGALQEISLIRLQAGGRLVIPPPIRRLALERLAESGEEHEARRAHAEAILAMAGPWDVGWVLRPSSRIPLLDDEAANVRGALAWTRTHAPAAHARLAAATGWWLSLSGRRTEAMKHVGLALGHADDPRLRAHLLDALGLTGLATGDTTAASEAVAAWRALADPEGLAMALASLSNAQAIAGHGEEALGSAREALEIGHRSPVSEVIDFSELAAGQALNLTGRHHEAVEQLERLAARAAPGFLGFAVRSCLADAELACGRPGAALRHYAEALRQVRPLRLTTLEIFQVDGIALASARIGHLRDAATALAVACLARDSLSLPLGGLPGAWHEEVRRALATEALREAEARVAGMGLGAGLEWAATLAP